MKGFWPFNFLNIAWDASASATTECSAGSTCSAARAWKEYRRRRCDCGKEEASPQDSGVFSNARPDDEHDEEDSSELLLLHRDSLPILQQRLGQPRESPLTTCWTHWLLRFWCVYYSWIGLFVTLLLDKLLFTRTTAANVFTFLRESAGKQSNRNIDSRNSLGYESKSVIRAILLLWMYPHSLIPNS